MQAQKLQSDPPDDPDDSSPQDKMEEDASVLVSVARDLDSKRDANLEQKSRDMLVWLSNLETEWRFLNSKIEVALARRKRSSLEELRCAVLAITEKQRQVTEMKTQICKLQIQSTKGKIFTELATPLQSLNHLQESLLQKVQILKDSIIKFLENVPLVDGTVLGDDPDHPDFEKFVQNLELASQILKDFSHTIVDLRPSRSPSPMSSRSPSPHHTPMRNLEIIEEACQELKSVVAEEVTLMKEIGDLVARKRRKELIVNAMKIYREDCKNLNIHEMQFP